MDKSDIKYRIVIKLENSFKEELSTILFDTYKEAIDALSEFMQVMDKYGFNKTYCLIEQVNVWEVKY